MCFSVTVYKLPRKLQMLEFSAFLPKTAIDLRLAYHQVPLLAEERHYTAFEAHGQLFQYKRLPFGVTNGVSAFQRSIDEFIKNTVFRTSTFTLMT